MVFVYGAFLASTAEIAMVRHSVLLKSLPSGCKVIADGGFRGEEKIITPYHREDVDSDEKRRHNLNIKRVRWRIEAVFSRIKGYNISP